MRRFDDRMSSGVFCALGRAAHSLITCSAHRDPSVSGHIPFVVWEFWLLQNRYDTRYDAGDARSYELRYPLADNVLLHNYEESDSNEQNFLCKTEPVKIYKATEIIQMQPFCLYGVFFFYLRRGEKEFGAKGYHDARTAKTGYLHSS